MDLHMTGIFPMVFYRFALLAALAYGVQACEVQQWGEFCHHT